MNRFYRLALATFLSSLLLVAIGSLARLQIAGAGCGNDWPLCNGGWLPHRSWPSLVEYVHRLVALTTMLLSGLTALAAFRASTASTRSRLLAVASFAAILAQSGFGGFTARLGAPAPAATLHLATAMIYLALAAATLATAAATRGAPRWLAPLGCSPSPAADRPLALLASGAALTAFLLAVFGASTSATGAFACATWPLCADNAAGQGAAIVHLGYRPTALLGTLAAAMVALVAWRRAAAPLTRRLALASVALVLLQTVLNAAAMAAGNPDWMSAPHLFVAALFWIVTLATAAAAWQPRPAFVLITSPAPSAAGGTSTYRPGHVAAAAGAHAAALATVSPPLGIELALPLARVRQTVSDYVALTKPGIMSLLLTTTLCAMLMAARGLPPFWLVMVTLLGGIFASGGANVLNCYIDRDIDGQMSRTRNRAIVAGRVQPRAALIYGVSLSVAAVLLLGLFVNWTAAALAAAGNVYYVFIYTRWLKRTTPYNIVIGGGAGAVPPLVGWAAVTGNLTPLAWGLFALVFAWTPPHFWALALLKQGEYTRASVPMLPVVRGEAETRRQIVIYTVVLALVSLALAPLGLGVIYLAAALLLNGIFLGYAVWLYTQPSKRVARQMFFYSLWYLAFIFAAAVVDRIVVS